MTLPIKERKRQWKGQKVSIPDDWDGETWLCIEVQWPLSQKWIGVLTGLLTSPIQGRFWNENTGSIIGAQNVGWQIYNRNIPFIPCDEQPPNGNGGDLPDFLQNLGGGVVIEESEMGQVVTDIKCEGGFLVAYFGPCCPKIICEIPSAPVDVPDGDDTFPPPTEEPLFSCRRAYYMAQWLIDIADKVIDVSDDLIPLPTAVMLAFPQVTFHIGHLANALSKAGDVASSDWEPSDLDFYKRTLACRWEPLLDNTTTGLTDAQFDAIKTVAETAFSATVGELLESTMLAIGQGDLSDLGLSGLFDDTVDCTCPPDSGGGDVGLVVWSGTVNVTREDGTYTFLRRFNGGLSAEHRFVTSIGNFKAVGFDHVFDIQTGFEVDDMLLAIAPVTPADELLHNDWHTSDCAHIDEDSAHGSIEAADRTSQTVSFAAGMVWLNEVWSVGKTALDWGGSEFRSCPQEQTAPKTYQWIVHIARVNGVSTGVVAIPPGV